MILQVFTASVRPKIQSPTEPWQNTGMRDEISHRRVVTFERRISCNRRIPDRLAAFERVFWRAEENHVDERHGSLPFNHWRNDFHDAKITRCPLLTGPCGDATSSPIHFSLGIVTRTRDIERSAQDDKTVSLSWFLPSFLLPRQSKSISDQSIRGAKQDLTSRLAPLG